MSQSGTPDCISSGMSVARDLIKIGEKALKSGENQDILNAIEFGIILETRCNYFASLEGVVLSHMVKDFLDTINYIGTVLKWLWLAFEVLANLLDDSLVISLALMSFAQHADPFNIGLIFGKLLKLMT